MILRAFSLLDTKVGSFSTPFFYVHEGYALRTVSELVQDMSTSVGRHPFDYTLYEVGEFDDQLGMFNPVAPRAIVVAGNLLPPRTPMPLEAAAVERLPNGSMDQHKQEVM